MITTVYHLRDASAASPGRCRNHLVLRSHYGQPDGPLKGDGTSQCYCQWQWGQLHIKEWRGREKPDGY